ncbi:MAG: anti-sigma factor domain-containing protein [Chloroflexota bacterium]
MHTTNGMDTPNCDTIIELIPAYSAGATTPEETALVEALLPDCPAAIDALTDYLMLADALQTVIGPGALPAPGAARETPTEPARPAAVSTWTGATPEPPAAPDDRADSIRLTALHPRQPATPSTAAPGARRAPVRVAWAGAAAAAAALVLLVLSGLHWQGEIRRLEREQDQVVAALLAQQNTGPVLAGDFAHRSLIATDAGGIDSRATVIWNPQTGIGSIYVTGLSPLDAQHNYHVWLVRDDAAVNLGAFNVDANGDGILLFQSDVPLESYDAIGVNIEPAGGSAEPTTPHLVIGEI